MNETAVHSGTVSSTGAQATGSRNVPLAEKNRQPLGAKLSIALLAWIIRVAAGLNLYASLLHHRPKLIQWLSLWVPFEISEGRRVLMFLTSILLFTLATGLVRGKRTAWLWIIIALALAPLTHWGRMVIWPQILINFILIGFLIYHRSYFSAKSDTKSVRSALVICPLLAVALIVFGTIRLHQLKDQTSGDDDWGACFQTSCELILVQHTETQKALTIPMVNFFSALRLGGTSIAFLGLFLTLRPVFLRRWDRGDHRKKAHELITRFGRDSFDSYALLKDKHYYFTSNEQAVIPYVLVGKFAVALADPIGDAALRPMAIVDFALFCRSHDWEPVFYVITEELIPYYEQAGFSIFKVGEEAHLQANEFHLKGGDFQNLRTICNNAHKKGITFRWYDASQGIDEALEKQLAFISKCWLDMKNAREMSFDMGAFSLEDIREKGASLALDSTGKALAFATWRSFNQSNGMALDLMRCLPLARNVMDFVLVESIAHFRAQGIHDIRLGMAPLANIEKDPAQLVAEEKVVQFIFQNLNQVYHYKSLFEFKRKYRPEWRGRYVAYRRGVHLPLVGWALVRVHTPEGILNLLTR